MFSGARYIVVDDNQEQLRLLVDALHRSGTPTVGLLYDPAEEFPASSFFRDTRVLFLDLHLIPGQGTTAAARYGLLASLLAGSISENSGPYLIVLWTSHPEERQAFEQYLDDALAPAKRPLAILHLDKNVYLGEAEAGQQIVAAIKALLEGSPQLLAFLDWEAQVLSASGDALHMVRKLVPDDQKTPASYSAALDGVLSRLAVAAVGQANVAKDPFAAVTMVLMPMLQDRMMNAQPRQPVVNLWKKAVTKANALPDINDTQSGEMNRVIHLAYPDAEQIQPADWGAVLSLPQDELEDTVKTHFGIKYNGLMNDEFRLARANRGRCQLCLVRIGAVCDYAQQKAGPTLFVLGILIPGDVPQVERNGQKPKAEFEAPVLTMPGDAIHTRLFVNARYQISLTEIPKTFTPLFRIREQLLMAIAAHCAEYVTRPGYIQLPH